MNSIRRLMVANTPVLSKGSGLSRKSIVENKGYAVFNLLPQWRAQQAARVIAARVAANHLDQGIAPGIVDASRAPVVTSSDEAEY